MKNIDIISIILAITTAISFGSMFVIVVRNIIKEKKASDHK
ncbi:MAG TPA: hypothetical protein VJQ25_00900 [Nitrospira sp.]|nr:hypothetical protein [Nitrospira sp.]